MSKLGQGLAAAAFLGLAGVGILALDQGTPAPEAPTTEPVVALSAPPRPALLPGACPAEGEATECTAGTTQTPQGCICLTSAAEVAGELADRPQDHPRLWVCPADATHPGTWTTWRTTPAVPAPRCRMAIPPSRFGGYSMSGVDLGHAAHLRVLCAPCDVQPGAWSHCPYCWLEGNCAQRCPVRAEAKRGGRARRLIW